MAVAPETPCTLYTHSIPGGWEVLGRNTPKNLPALEDHLHAKFHQDLSIGLDFYRELHCPLGGSNQKTKKNTYLKISFQRDSIL